MKMYIFRSAYTLRAMLFIGKRITMKKYKLIIPDITGEYDNVVKGFRAAEIRAKQLLEEHIENDPECYVACVGENEGIFYHDVLIFEKDWNGDMCWRVMVMGTHVPLYSRPLTEDEEEELEEWRNEKERHISDLTEDELKQLRKEICVGSIYLSDYYNSFNIDESELCDICDAYLEYLGMDDEGNWLPDNQHIPDTPEEFANYCMYIE